MSFSISFLFSPYEWGMFCKALGTYFCHAWSREDVSLCLEWTSQNLEIQKVNEPRERKDVEVSHSQFPGNWQCWENDWCRSSNGLCHESSTSLSPSFLQKGKSKSTPLGKENHMLPTKIRKQIINLYFYSICKKGRNK